MLPFSAGVLTEILSGNFSHMMEFLLEPRIHSQKSSDPLLLLISKSLHICSLLPVCTSRVPSLLCRCRRLVPAMSYKQKHSLPHICRAVKGGSKFPRNSIPCHCGAHRWQELRWMSYNREKKNPELLNYRTEDRLPCLDFAQRSY